MNELMCESGDSVHRDTNGSDASSLFAQQKSKWTCVVLGLELLGDMLWGWGSLIPSPRHRSVFWKTSPAVSKVVSLQEELEVGPRNACCPLVVH